MNRVSTPEIKEIKANWDVPDFIHALTTTRTNGYSSSPFASLNIANGVEDEPHAVQQNRALLIEQLHLPASPLWMNQNHGTDVVNWTKQEDYKVLSADAAWTAEKNIVCTVMTADCLPVFFYHPNENIVAVSHAGWKGLLNGIIENTVNQMTANPSELMVWMGPAIGRNRFEVGSEVRQVFCNESSENSKCFSESDLTVESKIQQRYLCDIYRLAKLRLQRMDINNISGGNYCTVTNSEQFFSYRRDGMTGRMANLIWRSDD